MSDLIKRIDNVLDWEQNMGYGDGFRANLLRGCRAEIKRLTEELKESRALGLKLAQDRETQDAENESLRNQNTALDAKLAEYSERKYVPMTDDEKRDLFRNWFKSQYGYEPQQIAGFEWESELERAVLARLPKPDTAERDALVARIDTWDKNQYSLWLKVLLADIRAHLVGGGE
jgi:hypothetical protein